jgi:hypothetical protein
LGAAKRRLIVTPKVRGRAKFRNGFDALVNGSTTMLFSKNIPACHSAGHDGMVDAIISPKTDGEDDSHSGVRKSPPPGVAATLPTKLNGDDAAAPDQEQEEEEDEVPHPYPFDGDGVSSLKSDSLAGTVSLEKYRMLEQMLLAEKQKNKGIGHAKLSTYFGKGLSKRQKRMVLEGKISQENLDILLEKTDRIKSQLDDYVRKTAFKEMAFLPKENPDEFLLAIGLAAVADKKVEETGVPPKEFAEFSMDIVLDRINKVHKNAHDRAKDLFKGKLLL